MADIDEAVRSGAHGVAADGLEVVSYRTATKVRIYRRILRKLFADLWQRGLPISWLDVGAGYGEVVEAVSALAPAGSRIEGIEPMQPKARAARARGLAVNNEYLRPDHAKVDVVSVIDVFSHIPDFAQFLSVISRVLTPRGEVFIETGNLADLDRRDEFPGELGLPDHLVFAGEKHLVGYLERAGFDVLTVRPARIDGLFNLAKNVVKCLMGRPGAIRMPYTSRYRQLRIRARLRDKGL